MLQGFGKLFCSHDKVMQMWHCCITSCTSSYQNDPADVIETSMYMYVEPAIDQTDKEELL